MNYQARHEPEPETHFPHHAGNEGNADQRFVSVVDRSRVLAPLYAKAAKEENLQHLLAVRRLLAEVIDEADKLIVDLVISDLEKRLVKDIRDRLRVV